MTNGGGGGGDGVGGGRETVEAAGESVTHARAQSVNIEQQSVTQARAKRVKYRIDPGGISQATAVL